MSPCTGCLLAAVVLSWPDGESIRFNLHLRASVHLDIISCLQRLREAVTGRSCLCSNKLILCSLPPRTGGSSGGCLSFRTRKQGACWELEGPAALVSPCLLSENMQHGRAAEERTRGDGRRRGRSRRKRRGNTKAGRRETKQMKKQRERQMKTNGKEDGMTGEIQKQTKIVGMKTKVMMTKDSW